MKNTFLLFILLCCGCSNNYSSTEHIKQFKKPHKPQPIIIEQHYESDASALIYKTRIEVLEMEKK